MIAGALALARKELRDILRERTIVLALATQLFVALFSAFLAVGLLALYDPASVGGVAEMRVGYEGEGDFDDVLRETDGFEVIPLEPGEGRAAFEAGELDAVITETSPGPGATRTLSVLLPEGEIRTSLLVNQLKSAMTDYERELREDRADRLDQAVIDAETDAQPRVSFTFAYSVLLPLLVATPVFLAGAITADSFSDEINEGTLLLLRSSPLTPSAIVLGKLLTPVLLVPAQVILWIGLMALNGLPVANVGLLLALSTVLGLLLAAGGILLASIVRREGPTQAGYTLVVMVLAMLSILLPRDPANLIARTSVDVLDAASYATMGLIAALAVGVTWAAFRVTTAQLQADAL